MQRKTIFSTVAASLIVLVTILACETVVGAELCRQSSSGFASTSSGCTCKDGEYRLQEECDKCEVPGDEPDGTCLGNEQTGWQQSTCAYAKNYCYSPTWGAEARRCCPSTCKGYSAVCKSIPCWFCHTMDPDDPGKKEGRSTVVMICMPPPHLPSSPLMPSSK